MVRRVKSYLKNMKIITDYKMKDYEEKLHQMSIECEAPAGGIPPSISSLGQHSVSTSNNNLDEFATYNPFQATGMISVIIVNILASEA